MTATVLTLRVADESELGASQLTALGERFPRASSLPFQGRLIAEGLIVEAWSLVVVALDSSLPVV